jgi:lipopolysaccharide/colanic/teichoic acid biosynthesis glycosyltransferase
MRSEDYELSGKSFARHALPEVALVPHGKRLFDIVFSVSFLIFLAPLLVLVWIAVRMTSQGPAIYKGCRVGKQGVEFEILKFRTMWNLPTEQLTTGLDDPRITTIGRWLRRYKLDELPQLVNVLRGEMSIVGPRPEFRQWVELYTPPQRAILSVRPGITDFASVAFIDLDVVVGRTDADERYLTEAFDLKNELRLRYVAEMSWSTDLKLIRGTFVRLLIRD